MNENRFQPTAAWSALLGMMLICLPAFGADTCDVSVTVREAGAPAPLPCRAWVSAGNKRLFEPEPGSCISYVKDRSFSCDGRFVMRVPTGKAVIHVEQGRDASALFTGRTPSDWKDVGFMRGTHDWLCAVTQNHKIVYSQKDVPWLFDLKKNPDELTNFFKDPQYSDIAKNLTAELVAYCRKYDDPRLEDWKIGPEMKKAAG